MDPHVTNDPRPDPANVEGRQPAAGQPPSFADEPPALGSLAQEARLKQIRQAQVILLIIGVLTLGFQGFQFYNVENEIDQALRQQGGNRAMLPKAVLDEARRFLYTVYGIGIGLGAFFLLMGALVRVAPVPVTILSLIVYVLDLVVVAVFELQHADPKETSPLLRGIFIKILITIALVKSIQAALAYEREKRESAEPLPAE